MAAIGIATYCGRRISMRRGFRSDEVRAIAAALQAIDGASLAGRIDGRAMARAGVCPEAIWTRRNEEARNIEDLLGAFDELRAFLLDAATAGEGLLVYLN
jgi:hypothetical protein